MKYDPILIIKDNEMHYFPALFGNELYMFRTDLLSIIRSLNTVFAAIGARICHTSYVDCLLASVANTCCCEYSVCNSIKIHIQCNSIKIPDDGQ